MSGFASRWLAWQPEELGASGSAKSAKSPDSAPSVTFGTAVSEAAAQRPGRRHTERGERADVTAGTAAAVFIRSAVLDGALVWLVRDDEAMAQHPDIIRSGLPLFFFDEVEQLRGKTPDELRAIAMVKTVFPTARVLQ